MSNAFSTRRLGVETLADRVVPAFSLSVQNPVVQEGQGFATVTISRNGSNLQQGEEANLVWGGTATSMMDYNLSVTDIIFSFAPGESSKSVVMTPLNDWFAEGDETVVASVWNGLEQSSVTITIQDAPLPVVSIVATDADASEAGPDTATFVVSVTGSNLLGLSVPVQIGGTASSGTDYSLGGLNGSVIIFGPGETSKTITLTPTQDQDGESDETALLSLSSGFGFTVDATAGSASATIHDAGGSSSSAVVTVFASIGKLLEGDSTMFVFERTGDLGQALSISVDVSGSANTGEDYFGYTQGGVSVLHTGVNTISFAAGSANASADIHTIADGMSDSPETIVFNILPPQPGGLNTYSVGTLGSATLIVYDSSQLCANDDAYSVTRDQNLSVAAPGVLDNDTNPANFTLMATLASGPAHGTLTFNSDGSFSYTPNPGWVGIDSFGYTLIAGGSTATVSIDVFEMAPDAADDSYAVLHDTNLNVPAPGVIGNEMAPDAADDSHPFDLLRQVEYRFVKDGRTADQRRWEVYRLVLFLHCHAANAGLAETVHRYSEQRFHCDIHSRKIVNI